MDKISHKSKNLAFVILIGGKSSRLGSDKGIFEFLGKPLISYQIETLEKFNIDIFLVAYSQQQIQTYIEKIDYEKIVGFIIDDRSNIIDQEVRSPMIGVYSAFKELKKLGYEKAFTLSCDSPLIKSEVVELIINESKGYDCCIPRWKNNYLEPLFAIYPVKKGIQTVTESLKKDSYKLLNLLGDNWNINYISIEDRIQPLDEELLTFININGSVDVEKLLNIYQNKI